MRKFNSGILKIAIAVIIISSLGFLNAGNKSSLTDHKNQQHGSEEHFHNKQPEINSPDLTSGPDPAPEGSFTVIVMPDTQDYADGGAPSGGYTGQEVFHEITQWIVDNKESH